MFRRRCIDPDRSRAIRGDLDTDPVQWEKAGVVASRPAAVLVGIVDRPEPTVLLTQRNADLSNHAGQIAFPGGKIDPHDETPLDAAVREAHEEVGLRARADRSDRLSRSLSDVFRVPHPAGGGAHCAGLR